MMLVLQKGYSAEETLAAQIWGECPSRTASLAEIQDLPISGWLPVGTVEFCRKAMQHQGIAEPEPLDYQLPLRNYLGQPVIRIPCHLVSWEQLKNAHVKPVQTKLPRESWQADTPVWLMRRRHFGAEWRVYVMQSAIQGMVRYDATDYEDSEKDRQRVVFLALKMIIVWPDAPAAYTLDIGKTMDGDFFLVEVNDAWALGFYSRGTCSGKSYIRMLQARWAELVACHPTSTTGNFSHASESLPAHY